MPSACGSCVPAAACPVQAILVEQLDEAAGGAA